MGQFYNGPVAKKVRRALKQESPAPEQRLWYFLRSRRLAGLKFRRQYSVGKYILDFYCPEARIGIEIDGDSHFIDDAQEYDQKREEYIRNCGISILRFTNKEVMHNTETVLEAIITAVRKPSS